jgi:hypothetical protein
VALEELILEGCERVSDDGLHHLRQCANLRVLDLSKCLNVTHLGVEDLLQGKQPDNDEQQPEPSNHTTKKKNAKGKKVEEQPRLMVDEEGELPWVLVGAKADQVLAAQAAGQRRKRKNRRKRKGGGAHHRTSITQLKIGGCTQISRIEWEEAKQHFPSVAIAWH